MKFFSFLYFFNIFLNINTYINDQKIILDIPYTVDLALIEFSQFFAYGYVHDYVGYNPF